MTQPPQDPPDNGWGQGNPPEQPQAPEAPSWDATQLHPTQPPTGNEPTQPPGNEPTQAPGQQGWPQQPTQGYQDPYQGGAYAQQYPQYPPGGEPKKSKTGLIIGLVVAGFVALIAIGIGAALLLSGDDEGSTASDEETSQAPTDDASDSATDEPSDSSTEGSSQSPDTDVPEGPRFDQSGYSLAKLDGWQDVTTSLSASTPGAIDFVAAPGPSINEARSNMIVEKQTTVAGDPSELANTWRDTLATAVGTDANPGPDVQIGGLKALSTTLTSTNEGGITVFQRAYLVVYNGDAYSIAFSAEDGNDDAQKEFDEILESWRWS